MLSGTQSAGMEVNRCLYVWVWRCKFKAWDVSFILVLSNAFELRTRLPQSGVEDASGALGGLIYFERGSLKGWLDVQVQKIRRGRTQIGVVDAEDIWLQVLRVFNNLGVPSGSL